jgi:hypothetical protein
MQSHPHESWRRWAVLTCLAFAAAQLPALPLGSVHWDGWIHFLAYQRGEGAWIIPEFVANGRPINGWLILGAFEAFGPTHGTLLVSWLCVAAATAFTYAAARRTGWLSPAEAALAATFVGINPAHQMMLASSSPHFFTAYAALFAALYCAVAAERAERPAVWEACTLGLSVFSAATGDSTAFMMPAIAWVRLAMAGRAAVGGWPRVHGRALARRLAAPLLGGLAFVVHFFAFPANADFAGERAVGAGLGTSLELFARFGVVVAVSYGLVWLAMAALHIRRAPDDVTSDPKVRSLAAFALALVAMAILPYWLADRKPTITGWSVRFLFTLGPGLALACIVWLRRLPHRASGARTAGVLLAALVLCQLARWPFWYERLVKDDAVVAFSRAAGFAAGPQTVCILDLNPTIARPYRSVEWTGMVQWGAGRADLLALQPASLERLAQEIGEADRLGRIRLTQLKVPAPLRCTYEMLIPEPRADWPVTVALGTVRRFLQPREAYERWLLARYAISGRPVR